GYHLGEKGKWSKAYSLYDVAIRVPLIIVTPQGKTGVSPRTVELLDMYPTLLELCGLTPPYQLSGHSLVPLLRDPNASWRYPAFSVVQYQGRVGKSVRTERWHYAEWEDGKLGSMLLDSVSDPYELKNLAADPAHANTVTEMKRLLNELPAR